MTLLLRLIVVVNHSDSIANNLMIMGYKKSILSFLIIVCVQCIVAKPTSQVEQQNAVINLLWRLIPARASEFDINVNSISSDDGRDQFTVSLCLGC